MAYNETPNKGKAMKETLKISNLCNMKFMNDPPLSMNEAIENNKKAARRKAIATGVGFVAGFVGATIAVVMIIEHKFDDETIED